MTTNTDMVVVPATGAAIDLAGPDHDLMQAAYEITMLRRQLADVKAQLDAELVDRCARDLSWTRRDGDWQCEAKKPTVEWDSDALAAVLDELVAENVITSTAAEAALKPTVTYRPRADKLRTLCTLDVEIERRIEACRLPERPRRVTVKRLP